MSLPVMNWTSLLEKYASARFSADVRADVGQLVSYSHQLLKDNIELSKALRGAKQTMIALTRACGSVELPYDLVTTVDDRVEDLQVEDIKRGGTCFKRFSYVQRTPQA
jgi:hypothetical protein